jgi:hypothetical protein
LATFNRNMHNREAHKLFRSVLGKSEIGRRLQIGRAAMRRILAASPKRK